MGLEFLKFRWSKLSPTEKVSYVCFSPFVIFIGLLGLLGFAIYSVMDKLFGEDYK